MSAKSYEPLSPLETVTLPAVVLLSLPLTTKTFAFVTELTVNLPLKAPPEVKVNSKLSPTLTS